MLPLHVHFTQSSTNHIRLRLCFCLSLPVPVCLCLSLFIFVCLVLVSFDVFLFICPSIHRSVLHPPTHLFIRSSIQPSVQASVNPSVRPFIHPSTHPFICLSIYISIFFANSRFLRRPQKRSRGNQLIHRCFIKTKSIGRCVKIQRVRQTVRLWWILFGVETGREAEGRG